MDKRLRAIKVPPIKCQGIKTKLVRFIIDSISWDGKGRWIEPFVGSGVVVLNVAPRHALLTDINLHVIQFYNDVASGLISPGGVRAFLSREGHILSERGDGYYYEVRDRFNASPNSHDFLFLNRSCFNGLIRFNSKGGFNVPSGRKPERFRKGYITKIVNQLAYLQQVIKSNDWSFAVADWREAVSQAREGDFVYADPPYIGRHTDYFNKWTDRDAIELSETLRALPCGFALSTWKENKYRRNPYLPGGSPEISVRTFSHFYHVGPTEDLRNSMEEALIIRNGFESDGKKREEVHREVQGKLAMAEI